jgi:hypothetical protein
MADRGINAFMLGYGQGGGGLWEREGIYLLSVEELASQLGLCTLELISWFVG